MLFLTHEPATTTKYTDSSSGLYFYGARYYDPLLGRFIQPDSIVPQPSNPQSLNRYSYCDNNPINYTDPTGHWKFKDWLGKIIGAVAATVTFIATGGNVAAAFAAFNITDTVLSSGQALYYGAPPGRVLGAIGMSIGLNLIIPTPNAGGDILWQVFAHAARGAAISTATAAAVQGGGKLGPSAAWGGGMGAVGGFLSSQQFQNWQGGEGFKTDADVQAYNRKIGQLQALIDEARVQHGLEGISKYDTIVQQEIQDPNMLMGGWPKWLNKAKDVNWKTVGVGFAEIISGVSAVGAALAAEVATEGISTWPSAWGAYVGVMTAATGVADVLIGIYGNPTTAEFVAESLKNNPLGRRITQITTEFVP